MIKRIEVLPEILGKSVFTARIEAILNTYRDSVGVDLFSQTVDGRLTAVFGGIDNSFTLICFDNTDFDELNRYFSFCNTIVFCDGGAAEKLSAKTARKAMVYEYRGSVKQTQFPNEAGRGSIADLYKLLQNGTDGDIELPPFKYWYTDFCARFNHLSAEYFMMDNAAAAAGFVTESYSLITGVAVDKACRGKGFGKTVLSGLIHNIALKYPHSKIIAVTENASGFYENLSFKYCGDIQVCEY